MEAVIPGDLSVWACVVGVVIVDVVVAVLGAALPQQSSDHPLLLQYGLPASRHYTGLSARN